MISDCKFTQISLYSSPLGQKSAKISENLALFYIRGGNAENFE
jgi:hypothetical protein